MQHNQKQFHISAALPAKLSADAPMIAHVTAATFKIDLCNDCAWPDRCKETDECQRKAPPEDPQ